MKPAPRFALQSAPDLRGTARIAREEAHHMRDVMRLERGDAVMLIDQEGRSYSGTISGYDREGAVIQILSSHCSRPRPPLIVAPAIIKGPRMDFLVEKAAELAATELWPIVSVRTVGKGPSREKILRWQRLAAAAAKQSLALPPMRVRDAVPFATLIRSVPRDTLALICSAGSEPMTRLIGNERPGALLIASGPEGDFAQDELQGAIAAGFVAVGLGPNRLRSETAAIAALALAGQWLNSKAGWAGP
ncbi:MAG TPA: RsmE family RNA methyltransferase [Candidatus Binataceae bacterium]|nr:RsmE family RNA methyltransferase [Candidatus Binataceae bacterium]